MRRLLALAVATLVACSAPAPERDGAEDDPDTAARGDTVMTPGPGADTPQAGPPRPADAPPAQPAPTRQPATQAGGVRGEVVASGTGAEPITTLQVESRGSLILTGDLEPELRRLAGATVVARGTQAGEVRRTLHVDSYEIVEINGERPVVGVVLPGPRLATGTDTLTIQGASPEMRTGSRIWITGQLSAGLVRVGSWGVIAPPST
jgi:hypothetical protein